MLEQLLLTFLSAIIGGFVGTLISISLPELLFGPRIKIIDIVSQGPFMWTLLVVNKGRTAASNAVGRVTIRHINQDDITEINEEIVEARKYSLSDDWRKSINTYLKASESRTGIEAEHIFWATSLSQEGVHVTTINPSLPERLVLAYSEGPWVDIPSEHKNIKRARLRLDATKVYYGKVVVGSANSPLSKPFQFRIRLGQNGVAIVEPNTDKRKKL